MRPSSNCSSSQRDHWKIIINDLIVRDEIRKLLKENDSPVFLFIEFVKSSRFSIFKNCDIEEWLKFNFIPSFQKVDKKQRYLPYFWKYISDYSIENGFLQQQHQQLSETLILKISPIPGIPEELFHQWSNVLVPNHSTVIPNTITITPPLLTASTSSPTLNNNNDVNNNIIPNPIVN